MIERAAKNQIIGASFIGPPRGLLTYDPWMPGDNKIDRLCLEQSQPLDLLIVGLFEIDLQIYFFFFLIYIFC